MRFLTCGWCVLAMLALVPVAQADEARVAVVDAQMMLTLEDGTRAQLMDMVYPDIALARGWMMQHGVQQSLHYTPHGVNRYGVPLIRSDMQRQMLHAGVAVWFAAQAVPPDWRVAEAAARNAKRGVWAEGGLVVAAKNAAQHRQHFRVVEGTVTRVYVAKNATYLNFGEDWHEDFSITISGRARKACAELLAQITPHTSLRVRGMIYGENGPMIQVTHPDQIEVLR